MLIAAVSTTLNLPLTEKQKSSAGCVGFLVKKFMKKAKFLKKILDKRGSICYNTDRKQENISTKGEMTIMKTVKSIKNRFGKEVNIDAMVILATGENWAMAKYKNYGFIKTYGLCDGYTVEFEN